jgi:hypothetical protein
MKALIAAAFATAALLGASASAQAMPAAAGLKAAIADEARIVEKTHGVHRYCARGPAGWHRHFRGRRIPCRRWKGRWR